jgi:hypothetical protein
MGWPSEYIKNGVLLFLQNQREDGFIARSVPSNPSHDNEHVKPFLSQIALLAVQEYGEKDWILEKNTFERLKKYLDYWLVNMDEDGNGLSEWMSAPHTGMDNQHERAGWWLDRCSEGVDLNCYLVREMKAFARLAEMAGRKKMAAEYRKKSAELAERIRTMLWDEEDGFYYDRRHTPDYWFAKSAAVVADVNIQKWKKKDLIPVRSVGAFAVLWSEVPRPNRLPAWCATICSTPRSSGREPPLLPCRDRARGTPPPSIRLTSVAAGVPMPGFPPTISSITACVTTA